MITMSEESRDLRVRLLRAARGLIIDKGWCQCYTQQTVNGVAVAYCATGALRASRDRLWAHHLDVGVCTDILEDVIQYKPLYEWNDKAIRTREDVVAAFDAAIAKLEGGD